MCKNSENNFDVSQKRPLLVICGVGLFVSAPFIFSALGTAASHGLVGAYVLMFFGQVPVSGITLLVTLFDGNGACMKATKAIFLESLPSFDPQYLHLTPKAIFLES
jgi:hypothetical protein